MPLYHVTVEYDYYVLAESAYKAHQFADDAARDYCLSDQAYAEEIKDPKHVIIPPHVPHELVYGPKTDTMLKDCLPNPEVQGPRGPLQQLVGLRLN